MEIEERPLSAWPPHARRRFVQGWIVTSLGFVAILWGVFHFTNATVGGPVGDFAHRRAYNDTKIAVHEAFPGDFLRAIVGLALVWAGAGMRTSARKMDASA